MKKQIIYKITLLFLFIIFILGVKSYAADLDFTYELDANNRATITAYKGSESNITIPSTIDGYEVKKIGNHAFNENRNSTNGKRLRNVIISEGITTIGDFAFIDCTNLESVVLPETLTSLGDQTFIGCTSLKSINIPSKITKLGISGLFQEAAFTEFEIPENVVKLGSCAFRACKELKKVLVYNKDIEYYSILLDGTKADNRPFELCSEDLILYGYPDSTTEEYANQNGFTFKDISTLSTEVPVSSIVLDKTSLSLNIGETEELNVTILPDNASDKTVIWSSSDTNIAVVENGEVTAKGEGSTIITVETTDGSKKAECSVTVVKKEEPKEPGEPEDNTIIGDKLPQTGINYVMIIMVFVVLSIIICILYKNYRIMKEI